MTFSVKVGNKRVIFYNPIFRNEKIHPEFNFGTDFFWFCLTVRLRGLPLSIRQQIRF
jgi:hypothetical protein